MIYLIAESIYENGIVMDKNIENNTIFDIDVETVPITLQCIQKTLSNEENVSIVRILISPNISSIKEEDNFTLKIRDKVLSCGKIIKINRDDF